MYYYFNGLLTELLPESAVIECSGVGYLLSITQTTYTQLAGIYTDAGGEVVSTTKGSVGIPAKLYAHYHVREDISELYGFYTEEECIIFKMLITVSGIGPKAALSILSTLTAQELVLAISTEDAKQISRAQGVGIKSAQKIIIELKDKLAKRGFAQKVTESEVLSGTYLPHSNHEQATSALMALGYTVNEANSAVKRASGETTEEIIRNALSLLLK